MDILSPEYLVSTLKSFAIGSYCAPDKNFFGRLDLEYFSSQPLSPTINRGALKQQVAPALIQDQDNEIGNPTY